MISVEKLLLCAVNSWGQLEKNANSPKILFFSAKNIKKKKYSGIILGPYSRELI